jgi:hypothetical protein
MIATKIPITPTVMLKNPKLNRSDSFMSPLTWHTF